MRWGMVIDLDKCTACQACVVACRVENNVYFQGPEETQRSRAKFWMQVLATVVGNAPYTKAKVYPRPCMQCDNPPCVQVCPVGATYKRPDGIVAQNYDTCIGCRYCMAACPYGARSFNWFSTDVPEPLNLIRNPDAQVPVRPVSVVEKCTFCIQRVEKATAKAKAEGRSTLEDGEVVTACTQTCTGGAIVFGDLDNPNSRVSQLLRTRRSYRLLEDLGTEPRVHYLTEG